MQLLKLIAEMYILQIRWLYLKTLLLCLTIAKGILGGTIAMGYFRTVMIILMAMVVLFCYLTFVARL